jgi:CheY-like chemotaxis protein
MGASLEEPRRLGMLALAQEIVRVTDEALWKLGELGQQKKTSEAAGRERPKILVVDDQVLVADTLTEILGNYGFHAVAAYGGETALEIAKKSQPDYLLTDILMPFMNGVELAIAVREMFPHTRILLFSGQAGITDLLLRAQQQGYEFELVAKPIHPERLVKILRNKK